MSAKKSWDVLPKAGGEAPAASRPVNSLPARNTRTSPAPGRATRLRDRRRKQKRIQGIVLGLLLAAVLVGIEYAVWLPSMRINEVTATGPQQDGVQQIALDSLHGTYAYLIPRNSIIFFSGDKIRRAVLAAYPDIAAVSVHRASSHAITVVASPRATAFIWCGASIDTPYVDGSCYDADAEGLLFAQATVDSIQASSTLRIFGPLDTEVNADISPVRAHVVHAAAIPNALRFVKAMRGLGAPVSALGIHDDEADLWLQGPTRITYILGHEEQATRLAASALPTLSLTDHSIEYIDLRFEGKVYVKKFGQ